MENSINNFLAAKHGIRLSSPEDAIRIMESGLYGMIFTHEDIDHEFFDLKNKILGETFQKLVNYRFPIAIVLPLNHGFGLRVTELAREHTAHPIIRFFQQLEQAKTWMSQVLEL